MPVAASRLAGILYGWILTVCGAPRGCQVWFTATQRSLRVMLVVRPVPGDLQSRIDEC